MATKIFKDRWLDAHGYEYKVVGNYLYWRTNYQTCKQELDKNNRIIFDSTEWLSWEDYDKI